MKKKISILGTLVLVLALAFLFVPSAKATGTVTSATGGGAISADNVATSTYTTLTGPTLACGATGDITSSSTITITAPSGFNFSTTTNSVTATSTNEIDLGEGAAAAVTLTPTATTITISVTTGNTTTATSSITMSGIKVIPTAGCPLASGELSITFSAGTFGDNSTSGTLTEVVGAMTYLAVRLPGQAAPNCAAPAGTVTAQIAGTSFNITNLYAVDQYFNTTTAYTGDKTISYTGPGSCAGVNPSYATSVSFTSGVASTLATTLPLAQVTTITATDGGSYGLASSNLTANPASITTLACSSSASPGTVWLTWTEAAGCTTGYDVRYLTSNIADDTDFGNATVFNQTWAGASPQAPRQELVTGLTPNIRYYFNQKTKGANNTLSTISNTITCIAPSQAAATLDTKAPTSSISDPKDGATILAGKSYTIKGTSADTGGSSVQKVELSLDGGTTWITVPPKTTNTTAGFDWGYLWSDPKVGTYNLKTRATDWVSNQETPGAGIKVTVATELPIEKPVVEKPVTEMTIEELKAKITEIQQKIIELLQQLIQLIQSQITELQTKVGR